MKKKTRKLKDQPKVYLGLSISGELREMVKKQAAREGRSISNMASLLLATALSRQP
jgi:hypothetical protein